MPNLWDNLVINRNCFTHCYNAMVRFFGNTVFIVPYLKQGACPQCGVNEYSNPGDRTSYYGRASNHEVMEKPDVEPEKSPSRLISERIAELGDWRGETLRRVRELIKEADPGIKEELKWIKKSNPGTPVWSHSGIICTGETYKAVVKLTFAKGASLKDPAGVFNASLEGNARRAIDIHQGDKLNESAFKDLIRAAVLLNSSGKKK